MEFPINVKECVITDFETYFDDIYSLRKLRVEEYVSDRRFKAHGVAVAVPGKGEGDWNVDWIKEKDIPKWLKAYRTRIVVNHNMYFDGMIWKLRYDHLPRFMMDTRLLANSVFGPAEVSGGNSLELLAERMGFQPKGKIDMFKGKFDLSPMEEEAMAKYAMNDADLTAKVFEGLLPQISRPHFELWLMDHTLRTYIDRVLPVRVDAAKAAIRKVENRVRAAVAALPPTSFEYQWIKKKKRKSGTVCETIHETKVVDAAVLASNPQFGQALLQVLKQHKVEIPQKPGKRGPIPALAKGDEGFIALKNSPIKPVSLLVGARLAKRSGDTQIARLHALIKAGNAGGFRIYLNYWGAQTGRWSGGSGLNPQNFPNPSRSTDEFEREVANSIRACVTPKPGYKFTAVDAANIEARVLAWWAGQDDLTNAFGRGIDVYSEFAAAAFHEEVRKPLPSDSVDAAVRFKLLRSAGKEAVLGLGYSMGFVKMESRMRSRPDIAPLFASGDLNTETCKAIVAHYRNTYKNITSLWSRVESAFHKAKSGACRMVNGVRFERRNRGVCITLPSGRRINYDNVRIGEHTGQRTQWVYGHGKGKKIYGGLLVENVVQAISRDILAEAIYVMEYEGFPVAYHVHDSVVCHVKAKDAKRCMELCIRTLSTPPEWGHGMQLGAEGSIEEYFA